MKTASRVAVIAKALVWAALWFCTSNLLVATLAAQCTNVAQVPNQTISSGTTCYSNNDTLTASAVTINGSASVTFIAGHTVHLTPGFRATAGSARTTFHSWLDAVPSALSVTPWSGTGLTQVFTWTVSNPEGYSEISEVQTIFNVALSGWSACYIRYSQASNLLYLADDSGATWMGGFTPGSYGTANNSRCSIAGSGSLVAGAGPQLLLSVPVTFQAGWAGLKNNYLNVYDSAGLNSGWQMTGTWDVGGSQQYYLTTAVSPAGAGSTTPSCPSGCPYGSGSQVQITATPAPGYQFSSFTGVDSSNGFTGYVTMNGNRSVTANFASSTSQSLAGPVVGPDLSVVSTIVPGFPNVPRPSGNLPSFSPQSSVLINRATINTNPGLPTAVIQQNGGNGVAVFNVANVSVPTGVTVEVGDFDYVVLNSAGPVSVLGTLQSNGPRMAVVGTGDQTVTGTLQAIGMPGGNGGNGGATSIINYVRTGTGGRGGNGGNGGSAGAGTNGYNGQGGAGLAGQGGAGWPDGANGASGNGPTNSPGRPTFNSFWTSCPDSGGSAGGSNGTQGSQGGGFWGDGRYTPAAAFGSLYVGLNPQPSRGVPEEAEAVIDTTGIRICPVAITTMPPRVAVVAVAVVAVAPSFSRPVAP